MGSGTHSQYPVVLTDDNSPDRLTSQASVDFWLSVTAKARHSCAGYAGDAMWSDHMDTNRFLVDCRGTPVLSLCWLTLVWRMSPPLR